MLLTIHYFIHANISTDRALMLRSVITSVLVFNYNLIIDILRNINKTISAQVPIFVKLYIYPVSTPTKPYYKSHAVPSKKKKKKTKTVFSEMLKELRTFYTQNLHLSAGWLYLKAGNHARLPFSVLHEALGLRVMRWAMRPSPCDLG